MYSGEKEKERSTATGSGSGRSAVFDSESDSNNDAEVVEIESVIDHEEKLTLTPPSSSGIVPAAKRQKEMTSREKYCEKVKESLAAYSNMLSSLRKSILSSKDLNHVIVTEYPGTGNKKN